MPFEGLPGGGEMGELIRAHDWAATPLGSVEAWPSSLRVAVQLLLNTRHPMLIWWGPELIQFYNDAYRETMGPERHPAALGARGRDTWAETWDAIGPQIEHVMAGRGATWREDQLVPVTRHGVRQDAWWTYGFSPIEDEAAPKGVGGVLVIGRETTEAVLARRATEERYRTLFESMDEGFCILQLVVDGEGRPVDYRHVEINPAFERQTGVKGALGKTLRELVPAIEPFWFEVFGKVARTGCSAPGC